MNQNKTRWIAATGFATMALLFSAASASTALAGNNGDVAIHESTTPVADQHDEPKVCTFYLDGFNFDNARTGAFSIVGQGGGPNAGTGTWSGTWGPADSAGAWHTANHTLSDGDYKLTWETGQGAEKHKVFKVDCAPAGTASSGGTTGAAASTTGGGITATTSSTGSSTGTTTGASATTTGGTGSATGSGATSTNSTTSTATTSATTSSSTGGTTASAVAATSTTGGATSSTTGSASTSPGSSPTGTGTTPTTGTTGLNTAVATVPTAILGQQWQPTPTTTQPVAVQAPDATQPAATQVATQQVPVQLAAALPSTSTDAPHQQPLAPIFAGLLALFMGAATLRVARDR